MAAYAADPDHVPVWYVSIRSVDWHTTHLPLRNPGTPARFATWFAPFKATTLRRANRKDLALLGSILEAAA